MCECDKPERNYYCYYDTPEGCDIDKKVMTTMRYGIVTGLILSTYDVLMYSRAVGMRSILKRYLFHTVPLALMGATFSIVANGALRAREKNDQINYFLDFRIASCRCLCVFYGNLTYLLASLIFASSFGHLLCYFLLNHSKIVMTTMRYGIVTGLILSTYDVLMYSRAVGMRSILKRYLFHTVPLALMGATFSIVANGALRAREKNDQINYFLGGLACGPILAAYLGSGHAVLLGGLALGVAGMVKKEALDQGHTFFPQIPSSMNMVNSWRNDYTLAKDPRDELIHSCGK